MPLAKSPRVNTDLGRGLRAVGMATSAKRRYISDMEHASKFSPRTTKRKQSWRHNLSNSKSQYPKNLHLNSRLHQSFSTRSGVEEQNSLHEKFDTCCQEGNLKHALETLKMMENIEIAKIEDYREIVEMHGLAGNLEEAVKLVDGIPKKHK
ncbi:unnamed protein product [Arabis nemorensis]|uniref:Pentacotripeptide-repeat region of PRORP domain-containing protein n=1 Tax=Arabis nemorensis TaxID=586526 RepID=A0A565C277_9BRAS|nr:unnamed protein product [Arabis nemorensis]